MKVFSLGLLLVGILAWGDLSAKSSRLRVSEMTPQIWTAFEKGDIQELVIEFRQGDQLPLSFSSEGDILETLETRNISPVLVKKAFWLKIEQHSILMSLDGTNFKSIPEILTGSFTASFVGGENRSTVANAINLVFKGSLR